jgi:hypothetical protein
MAKTVKAKVPKKKKILPIPPIRAWEVTHVDGTVETITAHDCSAYNDALSFTRIEGLDAAGDRNWVTVRAIADAEWKDVRLVELDDELVIAPAPEVSQAE